VKVPNEVHYSITITNEERICALLYQTLNPLFH